MPRRRTSHPAARRAEAREPEPITLHTEFAEQWRIMQPLLDKPPTIHPYEPGVWGPKATDVGGWRGPWVVAS